MSNVEFGIILCNLELVCILCVSGWIYEDYIIVMRFMCLNFEVGLV